MLTIYNKPLLLKDFHSHWHLIRNRALFYLLEPRYIETKTKSSLLVSSTKRKPSQFKVVEAEAIRAKRPSQCTACGGIGYRRTSKACP